MRPFLAVSLPEVPSYSEFASLLSLRTLDQGKGDDPEKTAAKNIENNEQAASILDVADLALKEARKSWEAISKANTEQARCIGCEDWWRTSMRNVMRSCITANIMVATSKKAISQAGSSDAGDMLKIEMIQAEKRYHPWWIVPQISTK